MEEKHFEIIRILLREDSDKHQTKFWNSVKHHSATFSSLSDFGTYFSFLTNNHVIDMGSDNVYYLSDKGKAIWEEYSKTKESENVQKNRQIQKMELEISNLVNIVSDYDTTKRRAKNGLIVGWISIIIAGLTLMTRLMCNKIN